MTIIEYNQTEKRLTFNDGLVTHDVHYEEPKKEDIFLPCDCNSEILRVIKWEDEEEYYLTIYSYHADKYSLWERVKILFGGKVKTSEIILSKENFNKLKSFETH